MAVQKPASKTQKPIGKGAKKASSVLSGIFCMVGFGVGMVFALPTVLVVGAGSLPTVVALVVDMHPRKFAAWTVGLFNFAGLMPYLGDMWMKDNSLSGAIGVLTDVVAWLVIYAAAGAGWMVYKGMPVVGGIILDMKAEGKIRKLKAERQKLINEWGKEAVGGLPG